MVVRIEVLPSGARLYTGVISQKRLANKHKRYISLCSPKTTADITIIAELIRKEPLPKTTQNISSSHPHPNTQKKDPPSDAYHLEACGHLAAAAIADSPLIILGTDARSYIHFSSVERVLDETDAGAACSLSLVTSYKEYRFLAETSTDYVTWIAAFREAFSTRNTSTNVINRTSTLTSSRSQKRAFSRSLSVPRRLSEPARTPTTNSTLTDDAASDDDIPLQTTRDRIVDNNATIKHPHVPHPIITRTRPSGGVRFAESVVHSSDNPIAPPVPPKHSSSSPPDDEDDQKFTLSRKLSSFFRRTDAQSVDAPSDQHKSTGLSRLLSKSSSRSSSEEVRGRSTDRADRPRSKSGTRSRSRSLTRLFTLVPSVRVPTTQSLASMFKKHVQDEDV